MDSIEVHEQTVLVHLHAPSLTARCPHCGTAGSRVHRRDPRTVADLAFGGRSLALKLLVRKWICPEALCSQHITAPRFPEVVQRYARMTDRLIKALQSAGVLTNGADAAQIASSFAMATTAKTIIRRVLQLPLPVLWLGAQGGRRRVGVIEQPPLWNYPRGPGKATSRAVVSRPFGGNE